MKYFGFVGYVPNSTENSTCHAVLVYIENYESAIYRNCWEVKTNRQQNVSLGMYEFPLPCGTYNDTVYVMHTNLEILSIYSSEEWYLKLFAMHLRAVVGFKRVMIYFRLYSALRCHMDDTHVVCIIIFPKAYK